MADGGRGIPQAKADDNEDVSWALSTADAMWSRGELADAIKWVRRAAEAASDAEADIRALELAKAAADLNSQIAGAPAATAGTSANPGPSGGSKPPPAMKRNSAPPPRPIGSAPPLAQNYAPASTTNMMPSPAGASAASAQRRPSNAPPPRQTGGPSAPQGPLSSPVPSVASGPSRPIASRASAPAPAPAAGRRIDPPRSSAVPPPPKSSASRLDSGQMNKVTPPPVSADLDATDDTQQVSVPVGPPRATRRPRPPEPTPPAAVVDASYDPTHTDEQRAIDLPREMPRTNLAAEIDAWPTQAISGDEHTEGGLDALVAALPPMRKREPSRQAMDPDLLATQAVRVVVWRTADGVRVAPAGTVVSAIACDAVLVALDPTADLSAWLTNKE